MSYSWKQILLCISISTKRVFGDKFYWPPDHGCLFTRRWEKLRVFLNATALLVGKTVIDKADVIGFSLEQVEDNSDLEIQI